MATVGQLKQKQPLEEAVKFWNMEHKAASPELRFVLSFELAKEASKDSKFLDVISKLGTKELRAECADVLKMLSKLESEKVRSKEYASMAEKASKMV
jgi:hypothetical protein